MRNVIRLLLSPFTIAGLAVAVAVGFSFSLANLKPSPASFFLAAVMVSAWYGGLRAGLFATVLAALVFDLFFLPPIYTPAVALSDGVRLAVFVAAAALVSSLNAARLRNLDELRLEAQRKDNFLAVLAHELRSPLSPLLHGLAILRHGRANAGDQTRAWEVMERQIHQLSRLVDDLLDASRVIKGKIQLRREHLQANQVIAQAVEAVRPLINDRGQQLEIVPSAGPIVFEADPVRLHQILVNLLTNAARYTEPGGSIQVLSEQSGGVVVLRVRDSGAGLAPEALRKIFEPFVQVEGGAHGGLGLGLSLVRGLVELHGGSITATSAGVGHGSEFIVRLPLRSETGQKGRGRKSVTAFLSRSTTIG
jgi:signal transduction histidine kinase